MSLVNILAPENLENGLDQRNRKALMDDMKEVKDRECGDLTSTSALVKSAIGWSARPWRGGFRPRAM